MARRPRISSAAFRASAERDADPLRNGTTTLEWHHEWHNEWQGGVQMNVWEMSTTGGVIADCMVRLNGRPARAGLTTLYWPAWFSDQRSHRLLRSLNVYLSSICKDVYRVVQIKE